LIIVDFTCDCDGACAPLRLRLDSVPLLCAEEAVDKEEPELVRWTLIEEEVEVEEEAREEEEAEVIEERRPAAVVEEGVREVFCAEVE
jgi:hypothetical protein